LQDRRLLGKVVTEQRRIDMRYLQSMPPPPLTLPAAAYEIWWQTAGAMIARNTLTEADLATLELYCIKFAEVQKLRAEIEKTGLLYRSESGAPKTHPLVTQLNFAESAFQTYARSLQLTPASRISERSTKDAELKVIDAQASKAF
jgi:P27 family predicted phage terminase small subunit